MTDLLHELILKSAQLQPHAPALKYKDTQLSYETLANAVSSFARGLLGHGLQRLQRVAVFLPNDANASVALFGISTAGGVFVPINPLFKPAQVAHILRNCAVNFLVTSVARARQLAPLLDTCADLHTVIATEAQADNINDLWRGRCVSWETFMRIDSARASHRNIDSDVAAIFYTSGSTGSPKGVVLSHRNLVTGAESVAQYLDNSATDRLLALLPFSFDYGFSQLSTAFLVGASVVSMQYVLPRGAIDTVVRERVTGFAGLPPLWAQLANLHWPESIADHLRYLTNSGGAMPRITLAKLRSALPRTRVFLMYGLTESFRSTYLPPSELDTRPDSIGKAIPNVEVFVAHRDGSVCATNEPGELVHRGPLVGLGYWNDPVRTAERYRPMPSQDPSLVFPEIVVWSGDIVRMDAEGFLYFVGRTDEMIKTRGYRVSPAEIEETVLASGFVGEVVATGVPDAELGHRVAVFVTRATRHVTDEHLLEHCRRNLPAYMVPQHIEWRESLPRNANGKYDRAQLAAAAHALFTSLEEENPCEIRD